MSGWRVGLLLLGVGMLPTVAAARQVELSYDMFAGGLHALTGEITVETSRPGYRVRARLVTQGFIDFLARWRSQQRTVGEFRDGEARPRLHAREGQWRFERRSTRLMYETDGDVAVSIDPPPEEDDRTPVTAAQRRGTVDLLSLVAHRAAAPDAAAACRGTAAIFDGRRRYDVRFDGAGEEILPRQTYGAFFGRALRCRIEVKPVAGFRRDMEDETGLGLPTGISVWLVDDAAAGLVLPVRFEAEIPFGRLIGHLTKVTPAE